MDGIFVKLLQLEECVRIKHDSMDEVVGKILDSAGCFRMASLRCPGFLDMAVLYEEIAELLTEGAISIDDVRSIICGDDEEDEP